MFGWTEQTKAQVPAGRSGTAQVRVSVRLDISPLKTSSPAAESLWIETLCGIPASLLAKAIWNGGSPGAALAAGEPSGPLRNGAAEGDGGGVSSS